MNTTRPSLLLRLRQSPSPEDWSRFVELYTPLLYFWARRAQLQREDASDLVQEVFVILVQKLPHFDYDPDRRFRGWLRTIAMNKLREKLRRPRPAHAAQSVLEAVDDASNVEALWEQEYREQLVRRALEIMQTDFEPTTWKACWELIIHDRPAGDVARQFNLSVNSVYLAKGRVLRRLKQELDGLLD